MEPGAQLSHTILLGFSHQDASDWMAPIMKETDIQFLEAPTGDECLDMFRNHPEVELVILPVDLQGKNGFEVIEQMKHLRKWVPVFLISRFVSFGSLKLAADLGCNELLQAPFSSQDLKNLVDKYLMIS